MGDSRIIVALDPEPGTSLGQWIDLTRELCYNVAGFKIGLPYMLNYGLEGLRMLRGSCDRLVIADFKLADVEHSMVSTISTISSYVDAVIAHAFIGLKGALEGLKGYLDSLGIKLILLISMSHPGSLDVIDVNLDRLLWIALRLRPWGLAAPATRPYIISYARRKVPWAKILAPGVGLQGAKPGEALKAGADYEIIGRLITRSPNPLNIVEEVNREHAMILAG